MDKLKEKALSLPLSPGVYLMKDSTGKVIYIGKAKKLKNRVTQYFQSGSNHSPKTMQMVAHVRSFEVIVAASEFEALVLECSLIKRYMPKYNILLKDDKGYPYLRLDMKQEYPRITMVNTIADDGAEYFGPFGSRGITNNILESIQLALQLPSCSKKLPSEIGKGRECLHFHMKQCAGWCQNHQSKEQYRQLILQAKSLLQGNYKSVANDLREQMLAASDDLNFELAAILRNRLQAVEALGRKQIVTAGDTVDLDAIGFAQSETKACFTVLHFSEGKLIDKEYEILSATEDPQAAVSALMKQYYLARGFAPKVILLPYETEDAKLFEALLQQKFLQKTYIKVPVRGDKRKLLEMAVTNAQNEVDRITGLEEKATFAVSSLGKMLGMSTPKRIEALDISNISGTDTVAGMVVFVDGKPKRSAYKRFKITDIDGQNDYAAMQQAITRRFSHYLQKDAGFEEKPDLLLIDGGAGHLHTALQALQELNIEIPVYGMVKDDRHRTRALIGSQGREIAIDRQQSVFAFIGSIQEETHRFAISYHRKLRSKRLKRSQLDEIPGIGEIRKQLLLKKFQSIKAIGKASLFDLEQYLPKDVAMAVYDHFHKQSQ